jgi:hypothetical protein
MASRHSWVKVARSNRAGPTTFSFFCRLRSCRLSCSRIGSLFLLVGWHRFRYGLLCISICLCCLGTGADSRLMYISVRRVDLCPKIFFTCMMSLVLWYSIIPFQSTLEHAKSNLPLNYVEIHSSFPLTKAKG